MHQQKQTSKGTEAGRRDRKLAEPHASKIRREVQNRPGLFDAHGALSELAFSTGKIEKYGAVFSVYTFGDGTSLYLGDHTTSHENINEVL